ncbi:MAG TPA: efflux transporter outer membrane subunit [Catalimonadaceae bacterium]|nr:efflux transporter outer membrane subunit [Catalimonadaceae bacterium]
MHNFRNLWKLAVLSLFVQACSIPPLVKSPDKRAIPSGFAAANDSTNSARISWKNYFPDPNLRALIEEALTNNQELNFTLQELEIARNEVRARKGDYLPFVSGEGSLGVEKPGRYTSQGSSEATTDIKPGKVTPDPLGDFRGGLYASWEVDVWHKLRNARKAAYQRYVGSNDGKNFLVTQLIAEIANSYYELLALDNQLEIVKQNIEIQNNAYKMVRLEKEATRVTELAVKRFEAQVLHTRGLQFDIQQKIVEMENRINFLTGRYPQPIARNSAGFVSLKPDSIFTGLPSQLLQNRPDIRKAEQELLAAQLDVKVARARFYPSVNLSAALGLQAFNPAYLVKMPESVLYGLAGNLAGPLVNRNALKALYANANARQIQAVFHYEQTVLNAFLEVSNQISNIRNLGSRFTLKDQEVQALMQSATISNSLFLSARADYMEVLLTQRDALESRFDLIETRKQQMNASVNMYRSLGGGWN